MVKCLTKTKARIEDKILRSHLTQAVHLLSKVGHHLLHQVIVMGIELHVLGRSLHVHHHIGHT